MPQASIALWTPSLELSHAAGVGQVSLHKGGGGMKVLCPPHVWRGYPTYTWRSGTHLLGLCLLFLVGAAGAGSHDALPGRQHLSVCSSPQPPSTHHLLPASHPCPHLPTPCRSLSVLRQGAMAGPGSVQGAPVEKRPGGGSAPHFLPLCKLPLWPALPGAPRSCLSPHPWGSLEGWLVKAPPIPAPLRAWGHPQRVPSLSPDKWAEA